MLTFFEKPTLLDSFGTTLTPRQQKDIWNETSSGFKWLSQQSFGSKYVLASNWWINSCLWIIFFQILLIVLHLVSTLLSADISTVSKVTTNVFSDHSRGIIHIHKYNNVAPNHLMIDNVLKNKAGVDYIKDLTLFIGWFRIPEWCWYKCLWCSLCCKQSGKIAMQTDQDLGNNRVINSVHYLYGYSS